jgi:hypothetical protein
MREVNFSIPNVNKASVHITTTLYDRRALDCTSTLPLINSLNHLAYLTTSSARIRDILTVDGGVERLVCILKEGKSKDMMESWKWNLAFQCVVNIGVRGSENVRTRVVEADMVPVIATILDNFVKVMDKCREKAEAEHRQNALRLGPSVKPSSGRSREQSGRSSFFDRSTGAMDSRASRRAPPPSIEIPQPFSLDQQTAELRPELSGTEITPTPQQSLTSPPERTTFGRHLHQRSHDGRNQFASTSTSHRHNTLQPLATALPSMDAADGFGLRPVRDIDRLPSMLPALQTGITSQPESPTTPSAPLNPRTSSGSPARNRRRPSLRQQRSTSGDSDDAIGDETGLPDGDASPREAEPIVDVQSGVDMQSVDDREMLDPVAAPLTLNLPNPSDTQEAETFNITHRSAIDGSIINTATPVNGTLGFSPGQTNINAINAASPALPPNAYPRYMFDRSTTPGVLAAMPRDEDVLMSLQLLAYVSKYCNLRSYFQQSHLVPKLKIGKDMLLLEDGANNKASMDESIDEEEEEEEYLLPDDFNIFPLVEKFTVRHHSKDMQYWAGVVMRNLCRKDDSRGGIRQCAYYQCGRWEEFQRQFAKCRRCRRTKYCSKECQKSAWVFHRHWCHAA